MPVRRWRDSKGPFYQYGLEGARYYYTPGDIRDRLKARAKAEEQGKAIRARGYKG